MKAIVLGWERKRDSEGGREANDTMQEKLAKVENFFLFFLLVFEMSSRAWAARKCYLVTISMW